MRIPAWAISAGLLVISNVFMTFAWYAHLKNMATKPWIIAALASWGIALFEYLLQVPGNRIGFQGGISLAQLKITQEVITLAVFVVFAWLVLKEKFTWNYAVSFVFILLALWFATAFKPGNTPPATAEQKLSAKTPSG